MCGAVGTARGPKMKNIYIFEQYILFCSRFSCYFFAFYAKKNTPFPLPRLTAENRSQFLSSEYGGNVRHSNKMCSRQHMEAADLYENGIIFQNMCEPNFGSAGIELTILGCNNA